MAYDFRERVAVVGFYDADTCYAVLDQGVGIFRAGGLDVEQLASANAHTDALGVAHVVTLQTIRHRCALIQAPEKYLDPRTRRQPNPAHAAAYAAAQQLVPPGVYPCTTYKADDTYDRPLVDIHLPDGRVFSDAMLAGGWAQPYRA